MSKKTRELVLQKIKNHSVFPSLPLVAFQLNDIVDKQGVTCSEIESIIMKDPVLTAKLLKVVNCSFYGFPQKISTISKAVLILGFNVIRTIIITTPIMEKMQDIDVALWEHATCSALCSGMIAKKNKMKNPEEISTAALIQNIGCLFIRLEFPQIFLDIYEIHKKENISLTEAENRCLGINHAEIGAELAIIWNLPKKLVEAIRYHHYPSQDKTFSEISSVIHFSDILISGLGVTSISDIFVPPLDKEVWKLLRISESDITDFLNNDESHAIWNCAKQIGEDFLRKDISDENEKKNTTELNATACETSSLETNKISIKKKLTFLQKRFSKVTNDPALISLMKIIAKHYIEEEKLACHKN